MRRQLPAEEAQAEDEQRGQEICPDAPPGDVRRDPSRSLRALHTEEGDVIGGEQVPSSAHGWSRSDRGLLLRVDPRLLLQQSTKRLHLVRWQPIRHHFIALRDQRALDGVSILLIENKELMRASLLHPSLQEGCNRLDLLRPWIRQDKFFKSLEDNGELVSSVREMKCTGIAWLIVIPQGVGLVSKRLILRMERQHILLDRPLFFTAILLVVPRLFLVDEDGVSLTAFEAEEPIGPVGEIRDRLAIQHAADEEDVRQRVVDLSAV